MHTNAVKFDNIPAEETCRFRASLHPIIHKLKERMDSCSKTENKEDQGGILQKTNNSGKGKERAANKGGLGEAAKKREEVQDWTMVRKPREEVLKPEEAWRQQCPDEEYSLLLQVPAAHNPNSLKELGEQKSFSSHLTSLIPTFPPCTMRNVDSKTPLHKLQNSRAEVLEIREEEVCNGVQMAFWIRTHATSVQLLWETLRNTSPIVVIRYTVSLVPFLLASSLWFPVSWSAWHIVLQTPCRSHPTSLQVSPGALGCFLTEGPVCCSCSCLYGLWDTTAAPASPGDHLSPWWTPLHLLWVYLLRLSCPWRNKCKKKNVHHKIILVKAEIQILSWFDILRHRIHYFKSDNS